jgi:PKD repeat protein
MVPFLGSLVVRDIPVPVVAGFTGTPTIVIPGNTVAFADTSIGNTTTWEWHFPGGTPEVSYEKNPVVTYQTVGIYDVRLTVANGFTSDSVKMNGYIVADFPASYTDKSGSFSCNIAPNPSNGNINLNLTLSNPDLLELSVFNLIGTQVYVEKNIPVTGQMNKSIDLTTMPEGIYFLKITGSQLMETRKLVIRR